MSAIPVRESNRIRMGQAICVAIALGLGPTLASTIRPLTGGLGGVARAESVATLTGVRVVERETSFALEIPTAAPPRVMVLAAPHRLVVDVTAESALPGAPGLTRWRVDRWGVREIRTSQFSRDPDRPVTRLVLEMDHRPTWELEGRAHGYAVVVGAEPDGGGPLAYGVMPARPTSPETTAPDPPPDPRDDRTPAVDDPATGADDPVPAMDDPATGADDPTPDVEVLSAGTGDGAVDDGDSRAPTTQALVNAAGLPSADVVSARRQRLWDRRAAELVADAEVRLAAADYRAGLESLARIFTYYPTSRHVVRAHTLAAEFSCELHFGDEAVSHLVAAFADTTGALYTTGSPAAGSTGARAAAFAPVAEPVDSVLARGARLVAHCPIRPESWRALSELHDLASRRLGASHVSVRAVGATLGIALAEAGESLDRARALLGRALTGSADPGRTARLHRALARCHEHAGDSMEAAREFLFAARLTVANDRDASLALRLRAADSYFRADALEPAAEQYRLVSGLSGVANELRSWALFQLGNCYYRSRRFDLAAETYTALGQAFPGSFWTEQARTRLAVLRRTGVTVGS